LFLQEWKKRESETKDSMLTLLLKVANKYVVSVIDDYAGERNSVALHSLGFECFVPVLVQVQSVSLTTRYGFTKQSVSVCDRRLIFSIIMLQLSTPYISKI
jgi:hypothetical protein